MIGIDRSKTLSSRTIGTDDVSACVLRHSMTRLYERQRQKRYIGHLPLHLIDYASEQQQQQQQQPAMTAGTEHIPFSDDELSYGMHDLVDTSKNSIGRIGGGV
mmetsp:Transcript_46217/g.49858  ORF Transcript_46217/g.49858 Transcript_46217/m.49858 type:complete len:103 (+) Transcript_46217:796-1104(+)